MGGARALYMTIELYKRGKPRENLNIFFFSLFNASIKWSNRRSFSRWRRVQCAPPSLLQQFRIILTCIMLCNTSGQVEFQTVFSGGNGTSLEISGDRMNWRLLRPTGTPVIGKRTVPRQKPKEMENKKKIQKVARFTVWLLSTEWFAGLVHGPTF